MLTDAASVAPVWLPIFPPKLANKMLTRVSLALNLVTHLVCVANLFFDLQFFANLYIVNNVVIQHYTNSLIQILIAEAKPSYTIVTCSFCKLSVLLISANHSAVQHFKN